MDIFNEKIQNDDKNKEDINNFALKNEIIKTELSENVAENNSINNADFICNNNNLYFLPKRNLYKSQFSILIEFLIYLTVFIVTAIAFYLYKPLINTIKTGVISQVVSILIIVFTIISAFFLLAFKKLNLKTLIILLLIAGYAVRLGYMLNTPACTRQMDTYALNGHETYAWQIFTTGRLPSVNEYQLYHPPLNASIQAFFMKEIQSIYSFIFKIKNTSIDFFNNYTINYPDYILNEYTSERIFLYSSCQILSVLYSFITSIVLLKILKIMGIKDKTMAVLAVFVIFFPRHIHFSAMLNNDPLCYLFSLLSLYFAIKWWKEGKTLKNIMLCSLFIGLGLATKMTAATICIPIAGIFIVEFLKSIFKKSDYVKLKNLIYQYCLFLALCAPLGLWFQVYAKIRFGQNLNYVFPYLNSALSTSEYNYFQRFLITFDRNELFSSIYLKTFNGNYNIWNFAFKSAIFGEFSYWQGESWAIIAILFEVIGAVVLAIALGYVLYFIIKKWKNNEKWAYQGEKQYLFITFLLLQAQIIPFYIFNRKMPYSCTMDFRYIMPMILCIALLQNFTEAHLIEKNNVFAKIINLTLQSSMIIFSIASALFYLTCI